MCHTDHPHPTSAPRHHGAFSLHAARLSLALLLGPLLGLTAAAPARAGLVIQSGISVISAVTSGSALETDTLSATSGFNFHDVVSVVAPGEAAAQAVNFSDFAANAFAVSGGGAVTGLGRVGNAQASAVYTLLFTLDGHHAVTGQMLFDSVGPGVLSASMDLSLEGGGSLLSATLDTFSAPLDITLTLGPGTYRFVGEAQVQHSGSLPDETGAQFFAQMTFTELGDPGNDVPEPASLALALSGLLACGVVRRRREPAGRAQPAAALRDATM